jgi:predicted DNA-binding protein (UPF0251 family)
VPRCRKKRHCRAIDGEIVFTPQACCRRHSTPITLYLDEYEALCLCDGEGLDQTAAGARMGVSRGTVQRLLAAARHKVATALNGKHALIIKDDHHQQEERVAPHRLAYKAGGGDESSTGSN